MINGKSHPKRNDCKNASNVDAIKDFGIKNVGVEATPTIIFEDGKVMTGIIPADYINQLLTDSSPRTQKKSASKAK